MFEHAAFSLDRRGSEMIFETGINRLFFSVLMFKNILFSCVSLYIRTFCQRKTDIRSKVNRHFSVLLLFLLPLSVIVFVPLPSVQEA